MELLPYESLMQHLQEKRRSLGIQQKQLAARAGVSAAQLSRMENGNAEAKYSTVYHVWKTLQAETDRTQETASDIATTEITWLSSDATGRDAKRLMLEHSYSQLPVRPTDGWRATGHITERTLLETESLEQPLTALMRTPFLEVHPETNRDAVTALFQDGEQALLVHATDAEQYHGIITPADII